MSHRVFSSDRAVRAVAVSALSVGLAVAAPSAARSSTDAPHAAQLQQLARKLVAAGAPGVIVRVDDGLGRPVEIAEQAPWTRRDHLLKAGDEVRMGSSTKTMTATLVLQLAAEGKLALTDPVEKWLPGKVPGGKAITLRMLLNHTSGLYDYTEDAAILPSILGKDRRRWTSAELLAVGVKHDPLFAPGAKWSYSNANYAALGAVLERATGSSLADLVRDRIARPLGLKHTYYATDATWRGPHAPGYEPDAAHMPPSVPAAFRHFAGPRRHGHVDVSGNDPGWGGAAGAVVSTAGDWSRFHTALMSGKLLPAAQLAHMRTTVPVDQRQPDGPGYGLGIQTGTTPCGTFWGHDGGIPGYLTANVTDGTGSRTVGILVSTEIWAEFEADPKIAKATQALQIAAICAMFGKPVPAAAQRLELTDQMKAGAQRELGLDPVLQSGQPRPFQPLGLRRCERRLSHVRQSGPPPQAQGLPKGGGRLGVPGPRLGTSPRPRKPFEPGGIHLIRSDHQPIPGRSQGEQPRITQDPPQPRHQRLQRMQLIVRRLLAPQRLRQGLRPDGTPVLQHQPRQQRPQPRAPHLRRAGRGVQHQGTEDADAHPTTMQHDVYGRIHRSRCHGPAMTRERSTGPARAMASRPSDLAAGTP